MSNIKDNLIDFETADNFIESEIEAVIRLHERYLFLEKLYLYKIRCPCILRFDGKTMSVEYLNGYEPDEEFLIQQSDFGKLENYDIGVVFTAFFRQYENIVNTCLLNAEDFPSEIDNSYGILKMLIKLVKDNNSATHNYIDIINAAASEEFKLIDIRTNGIRLDLLVKKSKITFDNKDFDAFLKNNIKYTYECKNIYQVCCSIIDYIFKFTEEHCDEKNNWHNKKISLRKCKNCGKFFLADGQNRQYCYNMIDGKSCSEWAEVKRKKSYVRKTSTDAEKLEKKINIRIKNYRDYWFDKDDDAEYRRRDEIYYWWLVLRDIKRSHNDYLEWLKKCQEEMNKKNSNKKYDDFYNWMLAERSKYGIN